MHRGEVVAGRFVIGAPAGAGAMGAVYRARDKRTGVDVALKLLHEHVGGTAIPRFVREAELLARVRHPGVVGYVAHGVTEDGRGYLAMEWLEGESLSTRLQRGGLTIKESVRLVARVADAVGELHRLGGIHRDIKPGNLLLEHGEIDRVRVLDLGIAKVEGDGAGHQLTETGAPIGTPAYMAPEQARGERALSARADVFSLGCVLFACLTGRQPFLADDVLTLLLKVVLEDAPRVSELRPGVPQALDDLVARMLSKNRALRPADGASLAAELEALGAHDDGEGAPASQMAEGLTQGELRVVFLLLARAPRTALPPDLRMCAAVAEQHGGSFDVLADGSLLVAIRGAGAAVNQAVRAARAGLALSALLPGARLSLAAGRGQDTRLPLGEVIERAVAELGGPADASTGIAVTEDVAALLATQFRIEATPGRRFLREELESPDESRQLLGRPTPFVGREKEMVILGAVFEECAAEPAPRVVVVTGATGVGKSRLRHQLLRRLGERTASLIARGDRMSVGSPFAMAAQLVRQAAGISASEGRLAARARIAALARSRVSPADVERVRAFLAELAGLPESPEAETVELAAARSDRVLMGDQIQRAFEDLLVAEATRRPLVLVLDDLQWGDLPSIKLIEAALVHLSGRRAGASAPSGLPVFVLAIGRPEVDQTFPSLFAALEPQLLAIGDLGRRASEKLVREVLGDERGRAAADSLIAHAGGNAFHLEELIRVAASGQTGELPVSLLAMVEARFESLEPEARRLLRAGSVFGGVFEEQGLSVLLGGTRAGGNLSARLEDLCGREFLLRRTSAEGPGEASATYVFRNALLRDAAYATLTAEDRALGHRLAAAWLEKNVRADPMTLAGHFERGGEPGRAIEWFLRAADLALHGCDFAAALSATERGIAAGASGAALGELHLRAAEARVARGEVSAASIGARAAMTLLPVHSGSFFHAIGLAGHTASRSNDRAATLELASVLLEHRRPGPPDGPELVALAAMLTPLLYTERADLIDAVVRRIEEAGPDVTTRDPRAGAAVWKALSHRQHLRGDIGAAQEGLRRMFACAGAAGDQRRLVEAQIAWSFVALEAGAHEEAEQWLRAALAAAEARGLGSAAAYARNNLGLALYRQGRYAESIAVEREAIAAFRTQGDVRATGHSLAYLALAELDSGLLDEGEIDARDAVRAHGDGSGSGESLSVLAMVLKLRGQTQEALDVARHGMELMATLGALEEGEALLREVHARLLLATGDPRGAKAALGEARRRILERASKISDPTVRRSFLERVPENARTLALANELCGEAVTLVRE